MITKWTAKDNIAGEIVEGDIEDVEEAVSTWFEQESIVDEALTELFQNMRASRDTSVQEEFLEITVSKIKSK